jgi:L-asparaginase II
MAEPLSVAVRRGEIIESVHLVHAVAVRDGELVAEAGNARITASLRSSAKPFQALPLARARAELKTGHLAIAAASHFGTPMHVEAVRDLLRTTGGSENELECGLQPGRPPEPIFHNCSGKHAAMIGVCRERDWPVEGYFRADHPLQLELVDLVADVAGLRSEEVETGIDGCGVICFAIPLERAALAFSRLERLEGGQRVAAAMRARPELVGGDGGTDTELMRLLPGWIAKGGAEGLMCAASADGLGVALKVADGNSRALRPALARFADRLGADLSAFAEVPLLNARGERVGAVSNL